MATETVNIAPVKYDRKNVESFFKKGGKFRWASPDGEVFYKGLNPQDVDDIMRGIGLNRFESMTSADGPINLDQPSAAPDDAPYNRALDLGGSRGVQPRSMPTNPDRFKQLQDAVGKIGSEISDNRVISDRGKFPTGGLIPGPSGTPQNIPTVGEGTDRFLPKERPLTTDEKLAQLIRLAETGKKINEVGFNRDLSGDAYLADTFRGNYITATGGQGEGIPRATQAPAFQPPIPAEELNLRERAMRLNEEAGAASDRAFNEDKRRFDLTFRERQKTKKDLMDIEDRKLQLGDKRYQLLKLQTNRTLDRLDKSLSSQILNMEREYDLKRDDFIEGIRRYDQDFKLKEDAAAREQQRLNLEEYRMMRDFNKEEHQVVNQVLHAVASEGGSKRDMINRLRAMRNVGVIKEDTFLKYKDELESKFDKFIKWLFNRWAKQGEDE